MIARLYEYFGVVGCASILAWLAALVLLAVFARRRQRPRAYVAALAVSVIGFVLAEVNSRRVSAVPLETPAQQPVAEEITTEAAVPAYRQMGKQRRDPSKAAPVVEATRQRSFKEQQLLEANRLDRWNLLAVRGTLLLVIAALVIDYIVRFNRTTAGSYPLPLAGRWLDRLSPKTSSLLAGTLDLKTYLETVVRRGETFLYFTERDPWGAKLPRLGGALPKLVYGDPADAEFYFDAVWFRRYCVVAHTPALLPELKSYLEWRRRTKATARRTVHVVLDLPAGSLDELIPLCREVNFRLVVKSATAKREMFDEVHA